jgi:sugar phosphate isomerase/epimerase
MQDLPWEDQCRIIADAGYTGVEVAAFTLVQESVRELTPEDRRGLVATMSGHGLECVGLHWLLTPPPQGLHFTTPDAAVRAETLDYFRDLIDFCGDLGGRVMIFGSPNQRSEVGGASVEDAKRYFAEGLAAVGDHAHSRDVKVLVEPLDTSQTNVVTTLAEAMEVVRMANHPAVGTMFDFHNTKDETDDLETLIRDYFDVIDHIQISEMDGTYLGTGTAVTDYVPSFQALKDLGYDKWISLEIFDFEPGGPTIANESMKVLQALEAKVS